MKMTQDEGPFWNVTIIWSIDPAGPNQTAGHSQYGPNYSTLSMNMLSLPLESHKDYLCCWNHNLYATRSYNEMNSSTQAAAQSILKNAGIDDGEIDDKITNTQYEYNYSNMKAANSSTTFFCWGKSPSDCPTIDHELNSAFEGDWILLKWMAKPGVDHFSYPTYTLTERSRHYTRNNAGWVMTKKAGKISMPTYGDFGITKSISGNWLCEGGDISYDGKYWIATRNFTHSPDVLLSGWDPDLYDIELSGMNPGLTGEMNSDLGLHD